MNKRKYLDTLLIISILLWFGFFLTIFLPESLWGIWVISYFFAFYITLSFCIGVMIFDFERRQTIEAALTSIFFLIPIVALLVYLFSLRKTL